MNYKMIKVKQGQSMVDISIQEYGNADGIFQLCLLNNLSIGEELKTGDKLKIDTSKIINERMRKFLSNKIIATK